MHKHQYIDRQTTRVETEELIADGMMSLFYKQGREYAPTLLRMLSSKHMSTFLGWLHYDKKLSPWTGQGKQLFERMGIDWRECVEDPEHFITARQIFERKIRYWDLRPMSDDVRVVVSPADARVLLGSFAESSQVFIKEKFFSLPELVGSHQSWSETFAQAEFAIFRLTPDKYHYNHFPVTGKVIDFYTLEGGYQSCNPVATVAVPSIYSKNRRVVTIIDTDVSDGTQVGKVAMIEVVALMIGEVVQCSSSYHYENPLPVKTDMMVQRGLPKSVYRPGSSTDILLFEPGRCVFDRDLVDNARRVDVHSRFSTGFGQAAVETEVQVRASIGRSC